MKTLGAEWNGMPDNEKEVYKKRQQADKDRYEREVRA